MLFNYLLVAFRNLLKHKGYTFINVAGLAAGIACCLLILLYVRDELSYDTFHEHAGEIYRFDREFTQGAPMRFPYTPLPLVAALQSDFPGIRTMRIAGNGPWSLVRSGDRQFQETRIYWADANFFSFFSFPLAVGDPATALAKPNSIVLTEEMARKFFGAENPLGRVMNVDNTYDLTVTGILKPIPENTHFHPDFLLSFSTRYPYFTERNWRNWSSNFIFTYFMLPPDESIDRFTAQLPHFLEQHADGGHKRTILHVMKLTDIHLHSHLDGELEPNGDGTTVFLFSAIALFILLIACINYMNLATARASMRMKEIGIRKTLGAIRANLIGQFLGEALLLSFVALLAGIMLSEVLLPVFNSLSGKALAGFSVLRPGPLLWALVIWAVVGLLAGSYPALVLSSYRPIQVLKGSGNTPGSSGRRLRQILVVSQFMISTALIICTLVVRDQMNFVRNMRLGLDKDRVLLVSIPDTTVRKKFDLVKTIFRSVPGVSGVGGAEISPAHPLLNSSAFPPALVGASEQARSQPDDVARQWIVRYVSVDVDFFLALHIPLAAGRYFSKDYPSDANAFVINELAVRRYGWSSPQEAIGKELIADFGSPQPTTGPIIGVVKDVHFESLHEPMKPIVFLYRPRNLSGFIVKIDGRDVRGTVAALEDKWHSVAPEWPLVSSFLDADYDALYQADRRLGKVFGAFSLIAILIACLGLTGLGAFVIEQRTKEIGIRKVLGAGVTQIVVLLSRDFVKLVLIAFLLASPVAYLISAAWLQDFAYRIAVGPGLFLTAGALAVVIAWCTVSYLSIRAALSNPVKSLRYE